MKVHVEQRRSAWRLALAKGVALARPTRHGATVSGPVNDWLSFLQRMARNPRAVYVCDPVIGDHGGLYVPEATAVAIRDRLMSIADVATPNRYELAWMAGEPLDDISSVLRAAGDAAPPTMLVTSAPAMMNGSIANLLLTPSRAHLAEHRLIDRPPNGLGDLTAAVFLARHLAGQPPEKALQSTTAAVFEILARTARRGGDELQIETDAQSLSHPMAMVQTRQLAFPSRDRRA